MLPIGKFSAGNLDGCNGIHGRAREGTGRQGTSLLKEGTRGVGESEGRYKYLVNQNETRQFRKGNVQGFRPKAVYIPNLIELFSSGCGQRGLWGGPHRGPMAVLMKSKHKGVFVVVLRIHRRRLFYAPLTFSFSLLPSTSASSFSLVQPSSLISLARLTHVAQSDLKNIGLQGRCEVRNLDQNLFEISVQGSAQLRSRDKFPRIPVLFSCSVVHNHLEQFCSDPLMN